MERASRTYVISLLEHLLEEGDRVVGDHHLHIQIANLLQRQHHRENVAEGEVSDDNTDGRFFCPSHLHSAITRGSVLGADVDSEAHLLVFLVVKHVQPVAPHLLHHGALGETEVVAVSSIVRIHGGD